MRLLPLILFVFGCGKAERFEVESAVVSSIYEYPAFFEAVCGFPLESSPQSRVEILVADGDAQPWFGVFGTERVPGTARIRLTNVAKKGESGARTCEDEIGFLLSETKDVVVEHRGKHILEAIGGDRDVFILLTLLPLLPHPSPKTSPSKPTIFAAAQHLPIFRSRSSGD